MGQQDISNKILEDYNDVFADIANMFYFNGEQRITEDSLEGTKLRSHYKNQKDELHEQERDVGKFWKAGGMRIALYAYENQTKAEKKMPLRVIGYDGAAYREQLLDDKAKKNYPVLTLVLYFGMNHWNEPKTLKEVIEIPKELDPYVNDYKIQVCEVAWLTDEQVSMLQSDFRIVADFFVQKRKNKKYVPSSQQIKHVDAVLKFLSVFAHDKRYEEILKRENREEMGNMCEIYDQIERQGIEIGIKEGTKALVKTCREFGCTREETLVRIQNNFSITKDEAEAYVQEFWG